MPARPSLAEPHPFSFRKAELADAAEVVRLVNSAYRGESSRIGWTTEADLLGGQRTDMEEVTALLSAENSVILLGHVAGKLAACAHLEINGTKACFGMFAVEPGKQNNGIGKRFLEATEAIASRGWGVRTILMTVITLRQPLIDFYERRGYRRTGHFKEFPQSEKFGIPKVAGLQLEVLEKVLATEG